MNLYDIRTGKKIYEHGARRPHLRSALLQIVRKCWEIAK